MLPVGDDGVGLKSGNFVFSNSLDSSEVTVNYLHWYPTNQKSKDKWRYRQYVTLNAGNEEDALRSFRRTPMQFGASEKLLSKILEGETLSIYNAEPLGTSSSLIVNISGQGAEVYSNALMCEVLASYGYDVLGIDLTPDGMSPELRAHLVDLAIKQFLNDTINPFEFFGVFGHGDGAAVALLYALEERALPVNAMVGLDPSFVGNAGLDEIKGFDLSSVSELSMPLFLAVSGFWNKTGDRVSDFNNVVFESAPEENAHMVFMEYMLHHSFVSDMHLRLDNSGIDFTDQGVDQKAKEVDSSYRLLTELILSFFEDSRINEADTFGETLIRAVDKYPKLIFALDER
jgi:pimeloyl-ACP methyl ester carboxylesterase